MLKLSSDSFLFVKKVNISTFKTGINVPRELHELICKAFKLKLGVASAKKVQINIDNKLYPATLSLQGTTKTNALLKIRYNVESEVAKKLRSKFSKTFICLDYDQLDFDSINNLPEDIDASIEIYNYFEKNAFLFNCLIVDNEDSFQTIDIVNEHFSNPLVPTKNFNSKSLFSDWLKSAENLSDKTIDSTLLSLHIINTYLISSTSDNKNIFNITDLTLIKSLQWALLSDNNYKLSNRENNNSYSLALQKYTKFLNNNQANFQMFSTKKETVNMNNDFLEHSQIIPTYNFTEDERGSTKEIDSTSTKLKTPAQYIELANLELNDEIISIINVLDKSFKGGIKLNSIINIKKFQHDFSNSYPEVNWINNIELLRENIKSVCINCSNELYMTYNTIVNDNNLTFKILNFVLETFESGKKVIYLESIFNKFKDSLLSTNIYNKDILEKFIMHYLKNDVIYSSGAILTESGAKQNINDEVAEVLSGSDTPLSKQEVFDKLSHIPENKIDSLLKEDKRSIYIKQSVYTHIDKFDVTQDDLFLLDDIIRFEIRNGFIAIKKLLEILKVSAFDFLSKNNIVHHLTLRDILKFHFYKEFGFKLTFVGKLNEEMSGVVAVRDFIKDKTNFTLDNLSEFLEENELPMRYDLFFSAIKKDFIRININDFILINDFKFNLENIVALETILRKYLLSGCVPLNVINSFSLFPNIEYKWNLYLLEGIIDNFSTSFVILEYSKSATKSTGIIVDVEKGFNNYDELLIHLVSEQDRKKPLVNENESIDFLFKSGYLTQKRYKGINNIFSTAKMLNAEKEGL